MGERIPVLLLNGTVGAGKTTTSFEVSALLRARDIAHVVLDLDFLSLVYPRPVDDPYGNRIMMSNLAALWGNVAHLAPKRVILARVILDRDQLDSVRAAIPNADITVVRLTASQTTIRNRFAGHHVGSSINGFRARSAGLDGLLDETGVADLVVNTDDKDVDAVAAEVLAAWDARVTLRSAAL